MLLDGGGGDWNLADERERGYSVLEDRTEEEAGCPLWGVPFAPLREEPEVWSMLHAYSELFSSPNLVDEQG